MYYIKVRLYGLNKADKTKKLTQILGPLVTELNLNIDGGEMGYPSVDFAEGATHENVERVQKVLQDAGFETE